ncbi:MAG: cytochrome C [Gammaproteobacteria bacterium]|nr:cytochrome C [Gammaproteobacteria bacterium]
MKKHLPLFAMMMLAGACSLPSTRDQTPIPEPGSPGARAFVARCSTCHGLPHPARLGREGWPYVLAVMDRRMEERGLEPLSEEERARILGYLTAHAR